VAGEHAHVDTASVRGMPDPGSGEAHDHCALSVDRRGALVSIAVPAGSTLVGEASRGVADAFVPTDTSRFQLAPKNSPPA
jgi:hypothetical protein